jgi:hypothetical protein
VRFSASSSSTSVTFLLASSFPNTALTSTRAEFAESVRANAGLIIDPFVSDRCPFALPPRSTEHRPPCWFRIAPQKRVVQAMQGDPCYLPLEALNPGDAMVCAASQENIQVSIASSVLSLATMVPA